MDTDPHGSIDLHALKRSIQRWAQELGFDRVGVAGTELDAAHARLLEWLAQGYQGDMDYLARHAALRGRPQALTPGTLCVLSLRMSYFPADACDAEQALAEPRTAYISRYALGRDYHKVLRQRLQQLADRIAAQAGPFRYRVLTDSAPVMEVELAQQAGLGWRGKHTLLLDREAGSWFFLGEIYTDLALPVDEPITEHCGTCQRCIDICPTQAIVAPYVLDARRCISYLTIEHRGSIPEPLRPLLGNRIYGCDDCQLVCPWNKYARMPAVGDFSVRNGLDAAALVTLFAWTEDEFDRRLQGSAIRRIGHERWLRNIAVALGNAPSAPDVLAALRARCDHRSDLVREHVSWALAQHAMRT